MLQNATPLRKSALTSLLVPRLPWKMHLCRSSSNVPRLPTLLKLLQTLTLCSLLTRCRIFCTGHAKRHLNIQKFSEHVVFVHFDLEMCFAPQRRSLFRHLKFRNCQMSAWNIRVSFMLHSTLQVCSEPGVLCAIWPGNVLRATTACAFSTSQFPKLFWARQFFTLFTSKCASRHSGVLFFDISTSRSAPSTVCFVRFDFDMCFAPRRRAIFHFSSGQMAPRPPF